MNYFELYPGDYLRDTTRLSLIDHGAYLKLLMAYYAEEQPLPADEGELYVIVSAVSAADKSAVRKVAARFFPIGDDGLRRNTRADEEIAKAQKRIETARKNGAKNKPSKNPSGDPPGMPAGPPSGSTQRETHSGEALHVPDPINPTEPNGSDAGASPESPPADPIWGTGLAFLIRKGIPEKPARALLGKVKQACGDIEAGAILADAETQDITDPAPWLMAAASNRRARAGPNGTAPPSKSLQAIHTLMRGTTNAQPELARRGDSPGLEQAAVLAIGRHASG